MQTKYGLLIAVAVVLFLYCIIAEIRLYKAKKSAARADAYLNAALSLSDELRRFKHNYMNILYGFGGHLAERNINALLDYYNETVAAGQVINNDSFPSLINVKNIALLNLLTQHVRLCAEQEIPLLICVESPFSELYMREPDLCQLLGIFLDNAREASAKTDSPVIKLDIVVSEGQLEFYLYNPFSESDDRLLDPSRGRGLIYAKKIVERSHNVINNTYKKNGYFVQQLVLRDSSIKM